MRVAYSGPQCVFQTYPSTNLIACSKEKNFFAALKPALFTCLIGVSLLLCCSMKPTMTSSIINGTSHTNGTSGLSYVLEDTYTTSSGHVTGASASFSSSSALALQEERAKLERMRFELELREREERARIEQATKERQERERLIREEEQRIALLKQEAIMRETAEKTRLEVVHLVAELRKGEAMYLSSEKSLLDKCLELTRRH